MRLLYIIFICFSLTFTPVTQASIFGAIAKIFKGSDEVAQAAGKSDEATEALKLVDEASQTTDDMVLVTKETAEASDDIPLVTKTEKLPVAQQPTDDLATTEVAGDNNILGDIAIEVTMQAAEIMAAEQEEEETTE